MKKALRVLLLEDSAADGELVINALQRAGLNTASRRVTSRHAFVTALQDFQPEVVLSGHSLAQFNAPAALETIRANLPTTPLIVVSGALDERATVACLRSGAEDVVLKSNLDRLAPAIDTALSVRRRLRKLSPKQLQVLRLIAEGYTTRELAPRLRVSVKTAETHRSELMKRLGFHNVVSVVRYAIRVGLVLPFDT